MEELFKGEESQDGVELSVPLFSQKCTESLCFGSHCLADLRDDLVGLEDGEADMHNIGHHGILMGLGCVAQKG